MPVWGCSFSEDSSRLVSGGDDQTAIVWELVGEAKGTPQQTLRGHAHTVASGVLVPGLCPPTSTHAHTVASRVLAPGLCPHPHLSPRTFSFPVCSGVIPVCSGVVLVCSRSVPGLFGRPVVAPGLCARHRVRFVFPSGLCALRSVRPPVCALSGLCALRARHRIRSVCPSCARPPSRSVRQREGRDAYCGLRDMGEGRRLWPLTWSYPHVGLVLPLGGPASP